MARVYLYKSCDTCRKAKKWLEAEGYAYEELAIREQPPSGEELKLALEHFGGQMKRLFNVSGQDYRKLGMKDRLPEMKEEEAVELLKANGNLVKRPFLVANETATCGFDPEVWKAVLSS